MTTDKNYIDQLSELSALRSEVSDLKAMMSVMQENMINLSKQISDMHKALFNNPIKSKAEILEEKKEAMKARLLMKNVRKCV